jgi:hypothetical protein
MSENRALHTGKTKEGMINALEEEKFCIYIQGEI